MITNQQPIEKAVRSNGATLDVHSIFYTIQGEGPFAGYPAVFLRLAGCNLQCPHCDTEYTEGRREMILRDIVRAVESAAQKRTRLVVITGGEPFRQPLGALFVALIDEGFFVQVETNGTLPPPPHRNYSLNPHERTGVYIVCSPKSGKVNPKTAELACCFKYVMDADNVREEDGLPTKALGHRANPYLARPPKGWMRPIYLQPADHQDEIENRRNMEAVTSSCLAHGYILQIQIHKIIRLP